MKKKYLAMAMALVVAAGMVTGCGDSNSKEEYKADIEELVVLHDVDTNADTGVIMEKLETISEEMEPVTSEGKEFQKSLSEYVEYVNGSVLSNLDSIDEKELEKIQEKTEDICNDIVENMDEFKESARDAGVSDDEISRIENIGILGL